MQLQRIKTRTGWTVYLRSGMTTYRGDGKTFTKAMTQALSLALPERK